MGTPLPPSKTLDWISKVSLDPTLIGQDALVWRKRAEKDNIELDPSLGGLGRGIQKINLKVQLPIPLLATSEMAEMATQSKVAYQRFHHLFETIDSDSLKNITLPACGAGLDALELYQYFESKKISFHISDLDPTTAWICEENFKRTFSNSTSTQFKVADAFDTSHLKNHDRGYAFLDPARRKDGERLTDRYLPDLNKCIEFLETFKHAQIKLSPGEDIEQLIQSYPKWTWTIIQMASEIKEISGTYGGEAPPIQLLHLNHTGELLEKYSGSPIGPKFSPECPLEVGDTVITPEPSLKQSKLLTKWREEFELETTAFDHTFKGKNELSSPPLSKSYQLIQSFPIKLNPIKKALRQHKGPVELRSMGVKPDLKLQQFLKPYFKRKQEDGPKFTLLLVKSEEQNRALLLKDI